MKIKFKINNFLGLGNTVPELGLADYPDVKPVTKTQFSMLTNEIVENLASKHPEVNSVVLCGLEAHVCVQGTTLALLDKGIILAKAILMSRFLKQCLKFTDTIFSLLDRI